MCKCTQVCIHTYTKKWRSIWRRTCHCIRMYGMSYKCCIRAQSCIRMYPHFCSCTCMYVCMHETQVCIIRFCVYIYPCSCTIHAYVSVFVDVHIYMCRGGSVCNCTHELECIHTCMFCTCTQEYIYTCTYACKDKHICK